MDLLEVGNRIREARITQGMTQAELAEASHVSPAFISNIELGKQQMNITVCKNICRALRVSADWMLAIKDSGFEYMTVDDINRELQHCSPKEQTLIVDVVRRMAESFQKLAK